MAPLFGVISDLQPGKSRIALQLRLIRSYDILKFNNRNKALTHECIFHDKEGDRIHATVNHASILKIKPLLQQGKVYAIKDFVITNNTMKMKTTECRYKILLFKQTRIVNLEDETFPKHMFNFKSYDEIAAIEDVQNTLPFDIMGVIVSSYQPITKELNGKSTKLMDVVVEDLEGKTLSCTLWENHADKMYEYLCAEPKMPVCVILQFCRPTIFRGEVKITSSYNVTDIVTDASILEIQQMKEQWIPMNKNRSVSLKMVKPPTVLSIEDELNAGISQFKQISELVGEKVCGTIYEVETIGAWAYMACKICLRKLRKDDDSFFCNHCESFDFGGRLRYKLRVCVVDNSGFASFVLWDRECLQLIGKSAEELSRGADENEIPFEIEGITEKNALFKIIIKAGETKMFDGAYVVSKINCDADMIEKYSVPKKECDEAKKDEGSSTANSRNNPTSLSDEEPLNKRVIDELGPITIKMNGKRVQVKQEKP